MEQSSQNCFPLAILFEPDKVQVCFEVVSWRRKIVYFKIYVFEIGIAGDYIDYISCLYGFMVLFSKCL